VTEILHLITWSEQLTIGGLFLTVLGVFIVGGAVIKSRATIEAELNSTLRASFVIDTLDAAVEAKVQEGRWVAAGTGLLAFGLLMQMAGAIAAV